MRSEIIPPFEEKTGIKTTVDINLGKGWLANLRAAGPENPPYDVLMTNETWASIEREEGFFEQIPDGAVPNMAEPLADRNPGRQLGGHRDPLAARARVPHGQG